MLEKEQAKGIIESLLFATARTVKKSELQSILEINEEEIKQIINEMNEDYKSPKHGFEIIVINDGYQLTTKSEYYDYLYPAFDKRIEPKLSQAALEILAIIAYNKKATKFDIETIRGVDSSATIYKLQEYNLIEQAGKSDLPGKPMLYKTTEEFLKKFGMRSLEDLPDLPKFKMDSNQQIVIDDLVEEIEKINEAPSPRNSDDQENIKSNNQGDNNNG